MKQRELNSYAALDQVAGFTRYQLCDGLEKGVEMIEVRTGGGLRFTVCPSRGLDLPFVELNGQNLGWRHPNGVVHPSFYSVDNFDWLRGSPAGLLTTCGLQSIGPDCEEGGEKYGLHDRISYLPAREVSTRTLQTAKGTAFEVSGTVREARLFGANLRLDRTLTANYGENALHLCDVITNDGFESAPYCILYHCNFGYPLLEEGAEVLIDSTVTPRTEVARSGLEHWSRVEAPQAGYQEQVFFHDVQPDESGECFASLWNESRKLGVCLRFPSAQLPHFTQWKMLGAGAYVMGLEPSNMPLGSRAELLQRGVMPVLEPGESREFNLTWEFVTSRP